MSAATQEGEGVPRVDQSKVMKARLTAPDDMLLVPVQRHRPVRSAAKPCDNCGWVAA